MDKGPEAEGSKESREGEMAGSSSHKKEEVQLQHGAVRVTGSGLHPKVRSHGFLDSTTNPPFQCPVAVPCRS